MSEQEKKSGRTAIDSSVIMVEKTSSSRHKQPYRPTELQDDTDLHHKYSKAPVVPSVVEELKDVADDSATNENIDIEARMEHRHSVSEKHKHGITNKLSSSTKRRDPSPESIALKSLGVDKKKTPLQPIPPQELIDIVPADKELKKADEDSITEEIADSRSPDVAKEPSEWNTKPTDTKKKEISWNDREYLENVVLKKSAKCVIQPSGININITRKCVETKSKTTVTDIKKSKSEKLKIQMDKLEKVDRLEKPPTCVDNIKQKLDSLHMKIRSVLHI